MKPFLSEIAAPVVEPVRPPTNAGRVRQFLRERPATWFTCRDVAEGTLLSMAHANCALFGLQRSHEVARDSFGGTTRFRWRPA